MESPGGAKAGRISKPYGLQGSVHIILDPVAGQRIQEGDPLFIQMDGQRVPYFVEELTEVSSDQVIVKFEFIDDLGSARSVAGRDVYLDPDKSQDAPSARSEEHQDLSGYAAHDRVLGYLGPVTGMLEHDRNPVLLVDHGGKELMVPAAGEIILKVNHRKRTILFDLPEGLTTL